MAKPLTLWIFGGVVAVAVIPWVWGMGGPPSDGEARQMLHAAALQSRSLPARDTAGDIVSLATTRIARIDSALCQPDPDEQVFGRNQMGLSRRESICRYRIVTAEGAAFALVLRASRQNAGPADRPTGNPLVDGSRRFVGRYRWSTVAADEAARLLSGWDG